jgi:hypothetical protein
MPSIFEKLNLKALREIVAINSPATFESELDAIAQQGVCVLRNVALAEKFQFAIAFATRQAEVDALSEALARNADQDALIWFAYPKGASKRFKCEFNRDTGWDVMRKLGFDTVRQVAIDEDWSALRFRRIQFIKASVR